MIKRKIIVKNKAVDIRGGAFAASLPGKIFRKLSFSASQFSGFLRSGSPLIIVCTAGIILSLVLALVLLVFHLAWGSDPGLYASTQNRSFARELRSYDLYNAPKRVLDGENPAQIERQLLALQKQARGVEEHLSALKRRRVLALIDRQYIASYKKAALDAAKTFGYSGVLAAVASDALAMGSDQLSAEERGLLKNYASQISQHRFDSLELGAHILAGSLETPSGAAAIPAMERLLAQEIPGLPRQEKQDLIIDDFLLKAVRGDVPGATARLNTILSGEAGTNESVRRMGAEFFYDHHSPLRAGELFSRLHGAQDIERAADSLVLAGEIQGARNIWIALASPEHYRSLYNLAVSSAGPEEEKSWLEKLLVRGSGLGENHIHRTYGVIRYTRLRDTEQSIAILKELKTNPLLDLELLRRRLEILPPTRSTAEVWMLINRNAEDEDLYEWAAWYFDHQKLYGETERLLKEAGRKGMASPWIELYKSLFLLRDGKINEAEKILKNASVRQDDRRWRNWRIQANLGRIHENRRAFSAALDYYEEAARMTGEQRFMDKPSAALLQMRIGRCLEALGRAREAARVMGYAAELDPQNLNIVRELRRLEGR